jgi:hypothetical protein
MKKGLPLLAALAIGALMPLNSIAQTEPVQSPGYLDLDGSRYMKIAKSDAFDISGTGTRTVSMKVSVADNVGDYGFLDYRVRKANGSGYTVSGLTLYTSGQYISAGCNLESSWTSFHCEYSGYGSMKSSYGVVYLCWVLEENQATFYIQKEGSESYATAIKTSRNNSLAIPCYCDILLGARYQMKDNTNFSIDLLQSYLKGTIDDVRFYDGALTVDEVIANRDSATPLTIEGKPLVAAYDFDKISGTTVPDISGNGHDGELVGSWPEYYVPSPRNVTVQSSNTEYGTVSISGTDATTVSADAVVTVTANPIEPAKFVNWVDAAGNVLSTDATYAENGSEDITLTANFGFDISAQAEAASIYFTDEEGKAIEQGVVIAGKTVIANVTPEKDTELSTFTVNGEAAELADDNTYTFTVDKPYVLQAVYFQRWDHFDGNVTTSAAQRNNRYIKSLTVSDKLGDTKTIAGPGAGVRPVYSNQSETVFETRAGQELTFTVDGAGSNLQTFVYIDYNNDGIFDVEFDENGAVTAKSELISTNGYTLDGGTTWLNSLGQKSKVGTSIAKPALPTIVIPEDLPAGLYRVRYKVDYRNPSPYGNVDQDTPSNSIDRQAGTIIDFTLSVKSGVRTVSVASANKYGNALISTEEFTTVTNDKVLTLVAEPIAPAVFMGWVDSEGTVVSKDARLKYAGVSDLALTANFGFAVTYKAGENGSISVVNADGDAITSGDIIAGDEELTITVTPDTDYFVDLFTVNGYMHHPDENGVYTLKVNNIYDIDVTFTDVEPTISGVEDIAVDAEEGNVEYFDLTGNRVNAENLNPGLYIRRSANKAVKVLIK